MFSELASLWLEFVSLLCLLASVFYLLNYQRPTFDSTFQQRFAHKSARGESSRVSTNALPGSSAQDPSPAAPSASPHQEDKDRSRSEKAAPAAVSGSKHFTWTCGCRSRDPGFLPPDAASLPKRCVVDIEDVPRPLPPVVPCWSPYRRQLVPGKTYLWCACGRSKQQPWCDGSHGPNDPQPIAFVASVQKGSQSDHLLCGCKYSAGAPFCDGSHIHTVDGYEE
eukprot:g80164.t1